MFHESLNGLLAYDYRGLGLICAVWPYPELIAPPYAFGPRAFWGFHQWFAQVNACGDLSHRVEELAESSYHQLAWDVVEVMTFSAFDGMGKTSLSSICPRLALEVHA